MAIVNGSAQRLQQIIVLPGASLTANRFARLQAGSWAGAAASNQDVCGAVIGGLTVGGVNSVAVAVVGSIAMVEVGVGGVAAGAPVKSDGTGRAIAVGATTGNVVGRALSGGSVGDLVPVAILPTVGGQSATAASPPVVPSTQAAVSPMFFARGTGTTNWNRVFAGLVPGVAYNLIITGVSPTGGFVTGDVVYIGAEVLANPQVADPAGGATFNGTSHFQCLNVAGAAAGDAQTSLVVLAVPAP